MDARRLADIVGGKLLGNNTPVTGFHFDSRKIRPGQIFVPLVGKRDGHSFVKEALSVGASGAFSSKSIQPPFGKFIIRVSDTFGAFKKVALHRRASYTGTVVGITGSVGKTTTKELLSFLLSLHTSTYSSIESYNNILGLTYTMANLEVDSDFYIQEVGTNSPGEVEKLSSLLSPNIGIVTTVEKAHLQGFGDFSILIGEKFALTEYAKISIVPDTLASYSRSRSTVTFGKKGDVSLISFLSSREGSVFEVSVFGEKLKLFTPVPGFSVVNAALISGAFLKIADIPISLLEEVSSFRPPRMRMEIYRLRKGILIDDSYNANPASFRNALRVLSLYDCPKVVVAGEMFELGEVSSREHYLLGEEMNSLGIEELIAFGREMEETAKAFKGRVYHFTDREEFLSFLYRFPFEGKAVLVKGSRGNRLEEAVRIVRERMER